MFGFLDLPYFLEAVGVEPVEMGLHVQILLSHEHLAKKTETFFVFLLG